MGELIPTTATRDFNDEKRKTTHIRNHLGQKDKCLVFSRDSKGKVWLENRNAKGISVFIQSRNLNRIKIKSLLDGAESGFSLPDGFNEEKEEQKVLKIESGQTKMIFDAFFFAESLLDEVKKLQKGENGFEKIECFQKYTIFYLSFNKGWNPVPGYKGTSNYPRLRIQDVPVWLEGRFLWCEEWLDNVMQEIEQTGVPPSSRS